MISVTSHGYKKTKQIIRAYETKEKWMKVADNSGLLTVFVILVQVVVMWHRFKVVVRSPPHLCLPRQLL